MNFLSDALRRVSGLATWRAKATLLIAALATLVPSMAFAAGGENIVLHFSNQDKIYLWISLAFGFISLIFAGGIASQVKKHSPGSAKMQEVGGAIREGALAYLKKQVMTMLVFVVILAVGLFFLYQGQFGMKVGLFIAFAFMLGVAASYIAGYAGMLMAVGGNMRTAHAALTSYKKALEVAFRSGAVAGLVTVGMGLIGATVILMVGGNDAMKILVGFGFGGSLAALFMRVGGGIFTKAADVGADLVGKVEAGIPEDDPRNPATIADNVGDNVGDCAGMAADVFESYEVTLVAAIILGAATSAIFDQPTWMRLIMFALMARGVGIIASIVGILMVKGTDDVDADPLKRIRSGFYWSAGIAGLATAALAWWMMGGTGEPIKTSQLISTQKIQAEMREDILEARDKYAAEKAVATWQVQATQLLDMTEIKGLGIPEGDLLGVVQQALDPRAENQPAPLDLSGYTPVYFGNQDNPILDYTILKPMTEARNPTSADVSTFGEVFGGATKPELLVVVVKQTITPPAPQAEEGQLPPPAQPPTVRTLVVGPMLADNIDKTFANQEGVSWEIEQRLPVTFYQNAEGKLAMGVPATREQIRDLQPFQGGFFPLYFTTDPAPVKSAIDASQTQTADQPPVPLPPAQPINVGMESSQVVPWYLFFAAIAFGLLMAFAIEALTDYYVSTHKKPTQEVAGVASAGPAPMIIQGFAYAAESSVFMVFAIVFALIFPLFLFNPTMYGGYILSFYGIALVGLGLLTTTGYVLAMDTFGPISDNAQGVYEMSGEGHDNEYGSKAVQRLDAAGNTTKALTKGFAIATAVVAAVALFHSYLESAHLNFGVIGNFKGGLPLDVPEIFLGMMIGGAAPFLFSAFTINAVGRASFQLINEVRRQFKSDPGIMAGTSKPDYARCVAIVTHAAQKELLGPGILAIALPVAVGFGFSIGKAPVNIGGEMFNLTGAQALGGFLAGTIISGQLMAVLLANSGGMWDNAKKIIEDGLYGGKGTEAHKAAVVCDTVGDPFKDTAGPALNPLIKVMNLVALLLAATIIKPFDTTTLLIITLVAVAALAFSIYISKKGSLSESLQAAQSLAHEGAEHAFDDPAHIEHSPILPQERRKITVDATPTDEEKE
jgi:K(+)-stimulated pyrophosphate-energized sodium pump